MLKLAIGLAIAWLVVCPYAQAVDYCFHCEMIERTTVGDKAPDGKTKTLCALDLLCPLGVRSRCACTIGAVTVRVSALLRPGEKQDEFACRFNFSHEEDNGTPGPPDANGKRVNEPAVESSSSTIVAKLDEPVLLGGLITTTSIVGGQSIKTEMSIVATVKEFKPRDDETEN
jgi:hypothetical protein